MLLKSKKKFIIIYDLIMVICAWLGAYWLRSNLGDIPDSKLWLIVQTLPIVIIVQSFCFLSLGVYRGFWGFASMSDLIRIIKSALIGTVVLMGILFFFHFFRTIPRSVFPLYVILLIFFLGGGRLSYRWFKQYRIMLPHGKKVMIVGAGSAGEMLIRDLLRHKSREFSPTLLIDDDRKKLGRELHGVRVMGQCTDIPRLVKQYNIVLIFIALPLANSAKIRELISYAQENKVTCHILPKLQDLVDDRVNIKTLREVSLDDLLGRDPVSLDLDRMSTVISEKVILVSGGGGSIGSELCRQIARFNPAELIVLEHTEFNLYQLEIELSQTFPNLKLHTYLVNVTDKVAVERVFSIHKIDMIFHAAAYKHVPMLESQIRAAAHNNIIGTNTLANVAAAYGVKVFVLISTDKAVRPANIMGITKRIAEIVCQYYNNEFKTKFVTVRFGNVLGSAGSVVPLFKKQLASGGPLEVTHPEITRFFMTIPEAAQLIVQAGAVSSGGEVFVLEMGNPIKIVYLAEQLIRLSGHSIDEIGIKYVGLRRGEKLHEELFYEKEMLVDTGYQKLLRAEHEEVKIEKFPMLIKRIEKACVKHDDVALFDILSGLVPEHLIKRNQP